jgi:hypothetical protein
MRSLKLQLPTSRENPNHKSQIKLMRASLFNTCHSSFGLAASLAIGSLALCLAPLATEAQNYAIDWYKVAGGGGTCTGSVYSVSGTIGQPDAGAMSGGSYSVTGGFWALFSVQSPGAPLLKIVLTATNTAVVSWPASAMGFNLQQNLDLGSSNWTTPAETVNNNGTTKFIIVSQPTGKRFFRLKN